ncbi:hypothetical protein ACOME3_007907 [Neoechinorhynchus agilis]
MVSLAAPTVVILPASAIWRPDVANAENIIFQQPFHSIILSIYITNLSLNVIHSLNYQVTSSEMTILSRLDICSGKGNKNAVLQAAFRRLWDQNKNKFGQF